MEYKSINYRVTIINPYRVLEINKSILIAKSWDHLKQQVMNNVKNRYSNQDLRFEFW